VIGRPFPPAQLDCDGEGAPNHRLGQVFQEVQGPVNGVQVLESFVLQVHIDHDVSQAEQNEESDDGEIQPAAAKPLPFRVVVAHHHRDRIHSSAKGQQNEQHGKSNHLNKRPFFFSVSWTYQKEIFFVDSVKIPQAPEGKGYEDLQRGQVYSESVGFPSRNSLRWNSKNVENL